MIDHLRRDIIKLEAVRLVAHLEGRRSDATGSLLSSHPHGRLYDFQLIGQSEDANMRPLPKDGIEHRQYLRQNVVASVRGFPRQGQRVRKGKTSYNQA